MYVFSVYQTQDLLGSLAEAQMTQSARFVLLGDAKALLTGRRHNAA
jgi:hypothetical protein